jgi:hypothetical protein
MTRTNIYREQRKKENLNKHCQLNRNSCCVVSIKVRSFIINDLLQKYFSIRTQLALACDNQGVIKNAKTKTINSLCHHHQCNNDLFLTPKYYMDTTPIKLEWVKGHSEKGPRDTIESLINQKLPREETCNVWCDKMASQEW